MKHAKELFSLKDKVAIVTGGRGLYGSSITEGLCEMDATVVIASRNGEKCEEYALKVLYEMIWAFGVLRLPLSNKSYWKKHTLSSTRSPWGEVPMEIYIVDHFLDDVIRPQCPW